MHEYYIGQKRELPAVGTWPKTFHVFDEQSAYAVEAALAAGRPLLVRGEPGMGKSQLARAAAHYLGRLFISEVVHVRSEAQDLQWQFDAVKRLGEAQAQAVTRDPAAVSAALDPLKYLTPGPLWWVFHWKSALEQLQRCYPGQAPEALAPPRPEGWEPSKGAVLLVDEIDKAEADLPNGLLEALGNGGFSVPWRAPVRIPQGIPQPLVVITTNEERELPGAFLRRCMVLHLEAEKDEAKYKRWLVERGGHHFGEQCSLAVRRKAADLLWADRREAKRRGYTPPGQAEYLDVLRALSAIAEGAKAQITWLQKIARYAFTKHPEMRSETP